MAPYSTPGTLHQDALLHSRALSSVPQAPSSVPETPSSVTGAPSSNILTKVPIILYTIGRPRHQGLYNSASILHIRAIFSTPEDPSSMIPNRGAIIIGLGTRGGLFHTRVLSSAAQFLTIQLTHGHNLWSLSWKVTLSGCCCCSVSPASERGTDRQRGVAVRLWKDRISAARAATSPSSRTSCGLGMMVLYRRSLSGRNEWPDLILNFFFV